MSVEHSPLTIIYILFLVVKYYSRKIKYDSVFFSSSSSILGNLIKLLHIHTSFREKQCLNYSKKKEGI